MDIYVRPNRRLNRRAQNLIWRWLNNHDLPKGHDKEETKLRIDDITFGVISDMMNEDRYLIRKIREK